MSRLLNNITVYGHRGARALAPENTLPGFAEAVKAGVHFVDLDVVMTKDHEIIAYHDLWLNPDILSVDASSSADCQEYCLSQLSSHDLAKTLIYNCTLADLKKFEAGVINPTSNYKNIFNKQFAHPGTKIPTLGEVVSYVNSLAAGQINFEIEIKNDPTNPTYAPAPEIFASILYQQLQKYSIVDKVEIQAFDWRYLYELQKLDARIKTAYLVSVDDIHKMHHSDPKIAGLYTGGKLLSSYNNSLPQMIKQLGGSHYEPEDVALTREDLEEAHFLGLKVVVWSWPKSAINVFDEELIRKLISWGVDGIITDDLYALNALLKQLNIPTPRQYPSQK